jgi:arylsulfatase A-like enzyme
VRRHATYLLQRAIYAGLVGLTLGILAGTGEGLHLVLTSHGLDRRPVLVVYSLLVDGVAGLLLGALAGLIWHGVVWVRERLGPPPPSRALQPARRNASPPSPAVQVTLIWRSLDPVPAHQPAISRRAALRLGFAVASAGALGLGTLALSSRSQRPTTGANTAYAFAQASGDPATSASASAASAPASASPAATAAPTAAAAPKPNVLLVTLDTLRADQLGSYGHPYMKTPALDALASQGARFDLHLIQEPQTNPSHASMFTGMYPASNHVRVHMVDKLPGDLETLATLFSRAGYATAALYSWMSFDPQYCGFDRGFHIYQNVSGQTAGVLDAPGLKQVAALYRIAEQYLALPKAISDRAGVQENLQWSAKGHADMTTDSAITQLQMLAGQPFFLWLHYFDPHYPYVPPAPYDTQYDPNYSGKLTFGMDTITAIEQGSIKPGPDDTKRLMSLYQGAITFMDGQLGRLFSALDSLGLTNTTIVAVTGDHGEAFGEHSHLVEGPDFFHPHDLYNTEQRVPLLLRYPGQIKPGIAVKAPTQAIDIFPTLLQLAGLPVPSQSQASSLLPLLSGEDSGAARVAYSAMQDYVFTSVSVPGWKLVRNNVDGSSELYDLDGDPGETRDASAAHPNLARQLEAKAQSWMKAVGIG